MSIWSNFEAHRRRVQLLSVDSKYYGVSFAAARREFSTTWPAWRFGGCGNAEGLEVRAVPAATYAVIRLSVQSIGETYRYHLWGGGRNRYATDDAAPAFGSTARDRHERPRAPPTFRSGGSRPWEGRLRFGEWLKLSRAWTGQSRLPRVFECASLCAFGLEQMPKRQGAAAVQDASACPTTPPLPCAIQNRKWRMTYG